MPFVGQQYHKNNSSSSSHPESGSRIAPKWQWCHNLPTWRNRQIFWVVLFFLSSLVTCSSFMSISSLVLELWQFTFIRDWPEIKKMETPLSEFCPISGDWGELEIPNLARMSLMKWRVKWMKTLLLTVSFFASTLSHWFSLLCAYLYSKPFWK